MSSFSERNFGVLALAGVVCLASFTFSVDACSTAFPEGKPVLNADQTVIILWDAARKTQHFIRKAAFKSEASDFGFLVPSPTEPELDESGNAAFDYLMEYTKPETQWIRRTRKAGTKKSEEPKSAATFVRVLQQKLVAGFDAVVLETNSTAKLVEWLQKNGYLFSPEIEAWAKPYVERGWKITALKVAKEREGAERTVAAGSFRMSFKTDAPLFPYRENDPRSYAKMLNPAGRLLRIYFVADARYDGKFDEQAKSAWTGQVAWSGPVNEEVRQKTLTSLRLPEDSGPAGWWLTEFEDRWPYGVAPSDVFFSRSPQQSEVRREPHIGIYYEDEASIDSWTIAGAGLGSLVVLGACWFGYARWRRIKRIAP